MKNMSATTDLNNTSLLATVGFPFPSKAEGIALCSPFALEAVLIVAGNFITLVLFTFNKKLRKKSMFLVINMAFADVMLGSVALPLYIYLFFASSFQLWTNTAHASLLIFRQTFAAIFSQASLISAVFISFERCYPIYWLLKHRTLSMRAYRVIIIMVGLQLSLYPWSLSYQHTSIQANMPFFAWISFPLTSLFIICACNISICRKFQKSNMTSQRQNRALQNQRLTKTLLFVSIMAVLSWLPLVIANYLTLVQEVSILQWGLFYEVIRILLYSNCFVNPFVYALRITEYRQALGWYCSRNRAVMKREDNKRGENRAAVLTPVMQLRTLPADLSHLQLEFEQEGMDTKL